jgi:hypothetical protein
MIKTRLDLRGVRDIRTRSGRVERDSVPYMAFMKISCLEMEKARREKEKSSSESRIKNIDARLEEIESEKERLLIKLGERDPNAEPKSVKIKVKSEKAASGPTRGFKIRY